MKVHEKLKSRKLVMTLLGFGVMSLTSIFNLPPDLVHMICRGIEILIPTYVGAQGIVDATLHVATALNDNGVTSKG